MCTRGTATYGGAACVEKIGSIEGPTSTSACARVEQDIAHVVSIPCSARSALFLEMASSTPLQTSCSPQSWTRLLVCWVELGWHVRRGDGDDLRDVRRRHRARVDLAVACAHSGRSLDANCTPDAGASVAATIASCMEGLGDVSPQICATQHWQTPE